MKPANPRGEVLKILQPLEREVARCQKCRLSLTRTNTVFARGNPLAELIVLGEGPGMDEDAKGLPFVGKAGVLLKRALESIGYDESSTYFMNTVKCRAYDVQESGWGKNRAPYVDELAACRGHTWRQLDVLPNKKVILALGSTAMHWLLEAEPASLRIGSARGKFLDVGFGLCPAVITYHPSFLLRAEHVEEKARAYEDFKLARDLISGKIDVSAVKLWSANQLRNDWNSTESSVPAVVPDADAQKPGKLLPHQADRYTTTLHIANDNGSEPMRDNLPVASVAPAFGHKPVKKGKISGKVASAPLFESIPIAVNVEDDDSIPF